MLKRLDVDIRDVPEVIAACVLHNVCKIHGEEFSEEWLEGVESQESESGSAATTLAQPQDSAANIRDALMPHFTKRHTHVNIFNFKLGANRYI